jgi:hypothetical protein
MMRWEIPHIVKTRGPVRIEKLSAGYQVWNDFRFISFFFTLYEAEACMNRIVGSAKTSNDIVS